MKTCVSLLTCSIIALISFTAKAQQFDPLIINDTTTVPMVLEETPSFDNYNFVYKQRLDSLQDQVPLPYNEYVQKYIEIYSSRKDQMGKMLGLSDYYFPIFEQALKDNDIPEVMKYLPIIESSMNPKAISRVGATGIWQFMFATAKGYGLKMDSYVDERRDPVEASHAAAAYFKDAYAGLGDWLLAIAAYNCGRGNVDRAIKKANSRDFWDIRPFLPMETRNYVPAFIAAVYVMNFSKAHDIEKQDAEIALGTDVVQVDRYVSLPVLAKALDVEEALLLSLNPSYKKKVVNGTSASPKRIVMPRVTLDNFTPVFNVLNKIDTEEQPQVILASNTGKRTGQGAIAVQYHRVIRGQSLSVIAQKYNVDVQDLKVWNKLKGSQLMPGQRLIVSKNQGERALQIPAKPTKEYISYSPDRGTSRVSGKI
ncbi:lytic transglycosylase domain-containing protein [Pedobacter immunditicola]|uniref:lytic transglycosylase domain-containing protein n=1 Tax=Pedobacter immunditicola TaxID=3133440 RepID=UPI00309DE435